MDFLGMIGYEEPEAPDVVGQQLEVSLSSSEASSEEKRQQELRVLVVKLQMQIEHSDFKE